MKKLDGIDNKFLFIPHLDFVESGKFQFPENNYNISPLSKLLPVRLHTINNV